MRVFVTGASGFVGSAIVKELISAGHQVLGLVRSDSGTEAVNQAGAQVHRGDINDLEDIKKAAAQCDAVIHTAFNHDFTRFKQNCEDDRLVITALGEALAGTNKPLVVTSGIGVIRKDGVVAEQDAAPSSEIAPRAATEEAANAVRENGVNAYIVRLPPTVHGKEDHGFVPMIIDMAKKNGESAYLGNGQNRWPAVHRFDAAVLYRLIIEQQPEQTIYHAVDEKGIPFKEIATAIGNGLNIPTVSKAGKDAEDHFTWFLHFASFDCPATSEQTRKTLGWEPKEQGLLTDLVPGIYL